MVARVSSDGIGRALIAAVLVLAVAAGLRAPAADGAPRRAAADLSVRSVSAKLDAGRLTVTLVAANGGRRAAPPSSSMLTWTPVGSPVVTVLRRFRLEAIRARGRRAATVAFPVPDGASGTYVMRLCLNVRATVREPRRGNNCRVAGRVTVPASGALGEVRTSTPPSSGSPAGALPPAPDPGPGTPPAGGGTGPPGPPETTIGRGPVGLTNSRTATFLFSTPEAGATFECRLDAGAWAPCTTPAVLTGLADGEHTLEVRATGAGGTDQTPAARTWTVDATPPDTLITAGPALRVAVTAVTVAFASSEGGASFECKLDAGSWSFCASPHDVTGLAPGAHTLQVRAYDVAGTPDPTPATRSWTVDLTEPQTTIASGPLAGATTGPATAFTFTSEPGATFECRLDGGSWAACTSPRQLTGLADGEHTFEVRAVDAAGNPDATPATRSWTVDATGPDTTIDDGPSGTVASADVTVAFSSTDPGATFECRLDGGSWAACTSPRQLTGLADGEHTFETRAVDALGNADAAPAQATWTIDTTAPDTTIDSGPSGTVDTADATVAFSATEAGATFSCRLDGGAWEACSSGVTLSGLADGEHTFEVAATDALGNPDATPAIRVWTVAVAPPPAP